MLYCTFLLVFTASTTTYPRARNIYHLLFRAYLKCIEHACGAQHKYAFEAISYAPRQEEGESRFQWEGELECFFFFSFSWTTSNASSHSSAHTHTLLYRPRVIILSIQLLLPLNGCLFFRSRRQYATLSKASVARFQWEYCSGGSLSRLILVLRL